MMMMMMMMIMMMMMMMMKPMCSRTHPPEEKWDGGAFPQLLPGGWCLWLHQEPIIMTLLRLGYGNGCFTQFWYKRTF